MSTQSMQFNSVDEPKHYGLLSSDGIWLTAESGEKIMRQADIRFVEGVADEVVIQIDPDSPRQTLTGIGTSFTESSAFVLAHLDITKRAEVMMALFSDQGANFSMARTPIGSCDFCVEGRYSHAQEANDASLQNFNINRDVDGFDPGQYPGVKDASYDLLPMIKEALEIKRWQTDSSLSIIASAWTAPPWMKDIEDWFIPPEESNGFSGTGGELKPEHYPTYALYLEKYLDAYRDQGVEVWAITPVNEPMGNSGQWESMHFSPQSQNDFIKNHLGPRLKQGKHHQLKLLIYDHSRDHLEDWVNTLFADPDTETYIDGAAIHWYESTFKVFEDVLDRVHQRFPQCSIIHSEGCIDNLGVDAPEGVEDPHRYKESGWFDNDDFWWNDNATDYAYSATWPGVNADDHPIYTPVHRYARNIIESLNHWVEGWVDWNCVLDHRGGPNHVGNYCGAPIMIDTSSGYVYYTPVFYLLSQFSRTIRPGDRVVSSSLLTAHLAEDDLHACATLSKDHWLTIQVLNTTRVPIDYSIQIGSQYASLRIAANALQSVRIQLEAAS